MIRILIAGKYNDSIQKIITIAQSVPSDIEVVGTAQDEQTALEDIDTYSPDVVVITLDAGDSEMVQIAQKIYVYKPHTITVVYGHNMDTNLFSQLISSGVRSAGEYPKEGTAFAAELRKLVEVEAARSSYLENKAHTALLTGSTILGFYSPKAGVGTTTCAVNTAVSLARRGKKVILLDLDLEFGDAAACLDIKPKKTIADLCAELEKDTLSIGDIESYSEIHNSGIYLLAAPKSPELAERVTPDRLRSIFNTLKVYFEYIIVDMPAGLSAKHAEIFQMINRVYFVTTLQLSSVTAAKQAMAILGLLGKKDNINVVVNRTSKIDIISLRDLHKILNCRVVVSIPSDYAAAINAFNRGIPIVTGMPHNAVARSLRNLAIYTDSKNTTLDIWDMSPGEISREYQKMDSRPGNQGHFETGLAVLKMGRGRRQINGGTA